MNALRNRSNLLEVGQNHTKLGAPLLRETLIYLRRELKRALWVRSGEDWFEGDVVDASSVMPSKGLTLRQILESSP